MAGRVAVRLAQPCPQPRRRRANFEDLQGLLAAVGDLWGELCRNGYRSLGLAGEPVMVEVDLEHPDLRGIAPDDLPLALVTCASAGVIAR